MMTFVIIAAAVFSFISMVVSIFVLTIVWDIKSDTSQIEARVYEKHWK